MTLPSLVVFGPQTTWPTSKYLLQLRTTLLLDPRLHTFLAAIKDLPSFWRSLVEHDARLSGVPGLDSVQILVHWVEHGDMPHDVNISPNVLTMPLTIIIQVIQYLHYIDSDIDGPSHGQILENVKAGGVQGFCTGLLTAIAVACSRDEGSVNELGAVALRLALCIGAYVDLDGAFADEPLETSSLAVRWRPAVGHDRTLDDLKEILKGFPNSYVSVIRDSTDVTVTTLKKGMASLSQHLSSQGMTVKPVGLDGRYHTPMHQESVRMISKLCDARSELRFPSADALLVPVRSNSDALPITDGLLHQHAVQCIMLDLSNWYLTISNAASQLSNIQSPLAVSFGLVDSVPSTVVREVNLKVMKWKASNLLNSRFLGFDPSISSGMITPAASALQDVRYPDHAIAVVGMACKFPGADSIDEFWELLTSGTSMLEEIPLERFSTQGLRRSPDGKLRFWGNFVRDADAFDHRFFKKSSREAASMDPQQRLLLQVAYEAMESSGYFSRQTDPNAQDIGCYLGVCASDYNDNVASHPPNAFSSLGTLRAFLSGKISHFFGWTGPSVTFDTACSSSAVAIHTACKAIESGECSQAVAGGASLYTSPNFYQNLAAASFLSPAGATKPFDAKADGYCRGEGIGLVVLKKLSAALKDGDALMGVIAGSAVNQNYNSTSITVPNSLSQIELYKKVSSLAGVEPSAVSFVEAHGTGTPVGDPIEFESIRKVFGGPHRSAPLHVASVKGNIGHLEGASGVAALIKTLLMIQHETIPTQVNHTSLNPKIPALEPDRMVIPLSTQKWNVDFKAACINNYGAAGSNAAMIVFQPPTPIETQRKDSQTESLVKYPIFISAKSAASLSAYCTALQNRTAQLLSMPSAEYTLASLAFNLSDKQNRSFPITLTTSAATLADLDSQLAALAVGSGISEPHLPARAKPVVLVFGGQISRAIGLNEGAYRSSTLLRTHLDQCDSVLRAANLTGLYPGIFETEAIQDVVSLHCMLFSLQYSCAKSWLDSGLQVDTVIGHSFGQLTALCVSGTLSLEDALRLVSGRASLMQKHWGPERGSMISLEADIGTVSTLISDVQALESAHNVEIACYNGPNSHVLVGSESSIQAVESILADRRSSLAPLRSKRLDVTYGFHSRFTEPLLSELSNLADQLVFNEPIIPLETCTEGQSWVQPGTRLIAEHTRTPVYFAQAVERIARRLGPCTWLEAGSSSAIIGLVRRTISKADDSAHSFQPVQLTTPGAVGSLVDTTINLWKAGHNVQFWPFHRSQKHEYSPMNLPPYQFEKSKHWLEWIDTAEAPVETKPMVDESSPSLLSLIRYHDQNRHHAEFSVNPRSEQYGLFVGGHAVLANPLCPAPLYAELVSLAATTIASTIGSTAYIPCIENLEIKAPLGLILDRTIGLSLIGVEGVNLTWTFELVSQSLDSEPKKAGSMQQHATGKVTLQAQDHAGLLDDLARFQRLAGYHRYSELIDSNDAESMRGSLVYSVFAKVVQYAEYYKGVRKVSAKDREVAGHVVLPPHNLDVLHNTVCNPLAIDNFVQVAGLHVNSLNECGANEVFVCTKVDRIQPGPKFHQPGQETRSWDVYSNFSPTGEREVVNDIFVFDATNKSLVMIILGARFTKVLISSLTKVLSRANSARALGIASSSSIASQKAQAMPIGLVRESLPISQDIRSSSQPTWESSGPSNAKPPGGQHIDSDLRELLNKVTDVPIDTMKDDCTIEELGIDSLMVTEVLSEIRQVFGIEIQLDDFQDLPDLKSLSSYLRSKNGTGDLTATTLSNSSTPKTTSTRATSVSDMAVSQDSVVSRLAKLVAEHLETTVTMSQETCLADQGLDSLLSIELASDIEKAFGAEVDMAQLDSESTFGDLCRMVLLQQPQTPAVSIRKVETSSAPSIVSPKPSGPLSTRDVSAADPAASASLRNAQQAFEQIRYDYDNFTRESGFFDFWRLVYPTQARLVVAYVVEAFASLGCPLSSLAPSERLPAIEALPKHGMLLAQLYEVLKDASLIEPNGDEMVRSTTPLDTTPAATIYQGILRAYPQHMSEHKLLNITGSKLAECLSGTADPLQLLFRSKENKELLEDVYTNGPMYTAITRLLGSFLTKAFSSLKDGRTIHILELGGGTGGTTKYIVDHLVRQKISFTYTFTDISGSLVAAARKKFASYSFMEFMILDIEKTPPERFARHFHTVISTNCIHATRDLPKSCTHIRQMLRSDGFMSLVEFTRNMFWFDLVFGLLEGWWLFEDGRKHVLADEHFWEDSMRTADFKHISWTDGTSAEARTLRIITGFTAEPENASFKPQSNIAKKEEVSMETVIFKQVGKTSLHADIYYPPASQISHSKRPVALMIHGGGHIMLSRKDIRQKQTKLLLDHGLLPVSIDYRLCPEVNIIEGPMADVCDALQWARFQLPAMKLNCPELRIDGEKVVVVGWSTGGHLAMTLAWTALQHNLKPPEAILAFYCPTDYEADCWKSPNFPESSASAASSDYNLLEAVEESPITGYNIHPSKGAVGGWLSLSDARSRIILHMNWHGQALPVLLNGLPPASKAESPTTNWHTLPQPTQEQIISISPHSQIVRGTYRTPTFLVHGTTDDLIPWTQSQETYDALVQRGVEAGVAIVEGKKHLFDLYRDVDGKGWEAVRRGYEFLLKQLA